MTQTRSTISDLWLEFAAATQPINASETQRRETRRAFYAGAFCLLQELKSIGGETPDEEGVILLDAFEQECGRFLSQLGTGGR